MVPALPGAGLGATVSPPCPHPCPHRASGKPPNSLTGEGEAVGGAGSIPGCREVRGGAPCSGAVPGFGTPTASPSPDPTDFGPPALLRKAVPSKSWWQQGGGSPKWSWVGWGYWGHQPRIGRAPPELSQCPAGWNRGEINPIWGRALNSSAFATGFGLGSLGISMGKGFAEAVWVNIAGILAGSGGETTRGLIGPGTQARG